MRKGLLLSLTCLLSTLTLAEAVPRVEWEVVQPAESRRDLVLLTQPGGVRVQADGRSESYALRSNEQLSEVVELRTGWAAAGRTLDGGASRLLVVTSDRQGFRRLELPVEEPVALQLRPRLLVDGGELSGVAWLEGPTPRQTVVKARSWSGADWGEATTVGPRAKGSQTGLVAATLKNRTELLLWSAFDGYDDELLFSESRNGTWTTPRRVAPGNRVPDVAPALIANRAGALAAWSRQGDDGYEVVVSRYRRGGWSAPKSIASGLFPQFVRRADRSFLVYRTAQPRGWGVIELASSGRPLRSSSVLATAPERPALDFASDASYRMRWPYRDALRGYWKVP